MPHRVQTSQKLARRSTKQGDETRNRILDVAEKLFSERGYDATTIRDVTAAARVQTGQFIHYFGQKEQLLREVIHRRSDEHVAAVKRNIELARRKNPRGPARPRDVIEAYIQIVAYKFSQPDEGWHRYIRLLALCTKSNTLRGLLDAYVKFIEPLNEEFLSELRKSCSYASDRKIRLAYYFVECTLIDIILDTHTLRRRSEGALTPADMSEFMGDLVNYMTAGFLRVIEQ